MCNLMIVCTNDKVGREIRRGSKCPLRSTLREYRYAKISKDVKAGQTILQELPFVVGPKLDSPLCCLGCYQYMQEIALCENCRWPVCSAECSQNEWHKNFECEVFVNANVIYNVEGEAGPQYECIAPLRALMVQEKNPQKWDEELNPMMDHNELRRGNVEAWDAEKQNVVEFLRSRCKLEERFSEDAIRRMCGILEVNGFEILPDSASVPIRGVYPKASTPSHNCVSNTTHSMSPGDFRLAMRATVDIKKGEEIFCSYTSSLESTMVRRAALKNSKYFDCDCSRCQDPTELGSHMSSMKCPSCDNGLILSSNPLDMDAEWKCTQCDKTLSGEIVQKLYLKIRTELTQLEYMEFGPEKLEAAEKILRNYRSSLHPRHSFNVTLWQILTELYGRVEGYTIDMLPDVLLERKSRFAEQLLEILDIVEPGMTRIRGRLLFEMHVAHLLMSRTEYQMKVITLDKCKQQVKNVITTLEESAAILGLEPIGSGDWEMAQNARSSAEQLTLSLEEMNEDTS